MARGPEVRDRRAAIGALLSHYDRSQLAYQLNEIVGERTYLRHGIEVTEGDIVLDVGANVGVAAAFFVIECRAGRVHCFEPVPPLVELLRENLRSLDACAVHGYGLSSVDGRVAITYYPAAAAMSGLYADPDRDAAVVRRCLLNLGFSEDAADAELEGRYEPTELTCELRTLSRVVREEAIERIDLLKIDVERAELDVLLGIDEPDWRRIAQVVAEVHDEDGRLGAVREMLDDHGFGVVVDQDPVMLGTEVHMVYARRETRQTPRGRFEPAP